ncbi:conserved hypothetical protein [Vibrio nigripulchritudo MADA3029]|uniref:hypothetical protein n=1 Tax=Vibrio TaxID=662 RepID=UPI00021C3415|nr:MULTISPECIES: hypothetical protein [Vibrio]EGU61409.1 hypothetical protein VINI7043_14430 [Vibrio nigripulchritudo ATCC 27043]CCN46467.1 conserved hypothetical protein [Vibrio nigripulchritudo MADA3020]CCN51522.1 conserved hypothetical protein [Vibrio nigripulchritudo MADA3021]CCN59198.1 conserved hypothetical protein [Vibrio nigripulchritudo MADA3029]BCL68442.1 hypothetical protein VNTUMSATTG_03790 [Vibrio nigripulchritudo]
MSSEKVGSENALNFDVNKQLEQIEAFTREQQQEVQAMIAKSQAQFKVSDPEESVEKIETEVNSMLSNVEGLLEQEMGKINQQLQQLLPSE